MSQSTMSTAEQKEPKSKLNSNNNINTVVDEPKQEEIMVDYKKFAEEVGPVFGRHDRKIDGFKN